MFEPTRSSQPLQQHLDGEVDPPAPPAPPTPPGARTFSQEEVTAMMAREKDQGKRAAEEALAKSLGCTLEEAKTVIADSRKRADAEKSEAQRAREAADAEKAEAERVKGESLRERQNTRIQAALMRAGVTQSDDDKDGSKFEAKLARLTKLVDVEAEADAAAVTAAVKSLKDEEPGLFAASGPGKPKPPNSDPAGKPPPDQPNSDAFQRGAERAKKVGTGGYAFMNTN